MKLKIDLVVLHVTFSHDQIIFSLLFRRHLDLKLGSSIVTRNSQN